MMRAARVEALSGAVGVVAAESATAGPAHHRGRGCATGPQWFDRMRVALVDRQREVICVRDLADEAGVHPVHAARVFRKHMGCTIGAYVRRLRVERARVALADPSLSLTSIALDTGFSDQAHFTRRFKEVTGMTPGRYRTEVVRTSLRHGATGWAGEETRGGPPRTPDIEA